ncbi:ABC transporter permease [Pseudoalteromonas denitrificans]|uniref:Duplicated orphan permease n=1 Tax=Pseudoalteromonas denitrificans DSM 6059 TaxID=1123010 RepID=A0A1I1LGA1_9GAMM|nr:ABC transporter permease [Pseudoalteromonas denitrificans]SFC70038.1 duplicated orphan permease [Pseudoalteromonas denitrificans DSM 6059]
MTMLSDIKFAFRTLVKNPKFTALTVFVMTTGLTLCIYMYSFIQGTLTAPLPFEQGKQIRKIDSIYNGMEYNGPSVRIHDFDDLKKRVQSYDVFDAYDDGIVNISTSDRAFRYIGHYVKASFFEISEAKPLLGRLLTDQDGEPGAESVVLIGESIWKSLFASDQNVLGKKLRVNSIQRTVVGVMPASYQFPGSGRVWLPFISSSKGVARADGDYVAVYGVLKKDVTDEQANSELKTIMAELEQTHPKLNSNRTAQIRTMQAALMGNGTPVIAFAMQLSVGFILLLACINVGNLLLSRAFEKSKEIAIRTALGAPRGKLISQMMWESTLISSISGILAILLAGLWLENSNKNLITTFPFEPPFWWNVALSESSVIAAMVIIGITALVTGLLPAYKATGEDVNSGLRDGTRGAQSKSVGRLSKLIVISEVVLSCALLLLSTGMVYSVHQQNQFDYGVEVEGYLTARIVLPEVEYDSNEKLLQYYQSMRTALQQERGVEAVSFIRSLPSENASSQNISIDGVDYGKKPQYPSVSSVTVAHNYFETMEVNLLEGRTFDLRDKLDSPLTAVVTQNFVKKHFKGNKVVGKRFKFIGNDKGWYTIIGVVNNVLHGQPTPANIEKQTVFVSLQQTPLRSISLVIKAAQEPEELRSMLDHISLSVERDAPAYNIKTLRASITERNSGMNFVSELFLIFSAASMVLAFSGIYGVMSNTIIQKTQEIGVRRALGANKGDIFTHFIKQSVKQLAIGLTIGVPLGIALVAMMEKTSLAQGSMILYIAVPTFISLVILLAVIYPVHRELKFEPCKALRSE